MRFDAGTESALSRLSLSKVYTAALVKVKSRIWVKICGEARACRPRANRHVRAEVSLIRHERRSVDQGTLFHALLATHVVVERRTP